MVSRWFSVNMGSPMGEAANADGILFEDNLVVVDGFVRRVKPAGMSYEAYMDKLEEIGLNPDGSLDPDPTPMQPPLGYVRQPTMVEHVRNAIRSENLRLAALEAGAESFEEADDFDVADDDEPVSAYEYEPAFEPVPAPEPAPVVSAAPQEPAGSAEPIRAAPAPSLDGGPSGAP